MASVAPLQKKISHFLTKKGSNYLGACFLVVLWSNCSQKTLYAPAIKQLDSIAVVINGYEKTLRLTDTVQLAKAIQKWQVLNTFVSTNVLDTLNKAEAQSLKQFYESGYYLYLFSEKRKEIWQRCKIMQTQVTQLLQSGESETMGFTLFKNNVATEINALNQLAPVLTKIQQDYPAQLQNFRMSTPAVEAFVKARNKGTLPIVIKDTLPF